MVVIGDLKQVLKELLAEKTRRDLEGCHASRRKEEGRTQ